MNPTDETQRNEVDKLLLAMHSGSIEPEDFARQLLECQVFLPVRDEKHRIAGFQRSTAAEPLLVEDEEGKRILVVFSAPDRAKDFVANYPGYGGGLLVEFSWVLRRIGADVSISLNPGADPGFDFDPEMVAMLCALLPGEAS